jgi:hypothetical protein
MAEAHAVVVCKKPPADHADVMALGKPVVAAFKARNLEGVRRSCAAMIEQIERLPVGDYEWT